MGCGRGWGGVWKLLDLGFGILWMWWGSMARVVVCLVEE